VSANKDPSTAIDGSTNVANLQRVYEILFNCSIVAVPCADYLGARPLLADLPLIQRLETNLPARYSDYDQSSPDEAIAAEAPCPWRMNFRNNHTGQAMMQSTFAWATQHRRPAKAKPV
jgi:hypothetical protein